MAGSAQAAETNTYTAGAGQVPIEILAGTGTAEGQPTTPADKYPSTITVSGAADRIDNLTVTLTGFSHQWPRDVDILLKGPQGQVAMLMSDVCGRAAITDRNLTFDDNASDALPPGTPNQPDPMSGVVPPETPDLCLSGTYKPTNGGLLPGVDDYASDLFPAPAPGVPAGATDYPASLSVFNGTNPNGTWELYVADDSAGSVGSIQNWSLQITTPDRPAPPTTTPPATTPPATVQQQGPVCLPEPTTKAPSSKKGKVTLSATQFRINQRIFAAGVLRANAIDKWLRDGIQTNDLCGGGITAAKLAPGITTGAGPATALTPPSPRAVKVPPLKVKKGVTFTATRGQLLINRRIAVALKERALALEARLNGKLTGGDLADGAVTQAKLASGLAITATPALAKPAPSTNVKGEDVKIGTVRRDVATVRTSQQIAADGIRILNRVRAQLQSGLSAENFADGSIVTANLAPGLRK